MPADPDAVPPVDLLEQIHATLAGFDEVIGDRAVHVELSRVSALIEPEVFRRALGALVAHLIERSGPSDPITVRVARADDHIRIDVLDEDGRRSGDPPELGSVAAALEPEGASIVAGPAGGELVGRITVRAAGRGSAPAA